MVFIMDFMALVKIKPKYLPNKDNYQANYQFKISLKLNSFYSVKFNFFIHFLSKLIRKEAPIK